MKNLLFLPLMLLTTLFALTSCSEDAPIPTGNQDPSQVEGSNGRYLVLYCSRTGNTERMAQTIQTALDCDLVEVVPETPYDNSYDAMLDRAQNELAAIEQGNYPPITTSIESFDDYDIVFIGYPIWYGHMATPMQTFLHNHAELLADKHIALFASSGSSGISTSTNDARGLVPDAPFTEPLLLTSSTLEDMEGRIADWLEQLGANSQEMNQ